MADRFYLMPYVGTGLTHQTGRCGKYWNSFSGHTVIFYGLEPICLLRARNVTTEQHDAARVNIDVASFPLDLDSTVSAQALTTIQSTFESANIPQEIAVLGMKYSRLLKRVWTLFRMTQIFYGRGAARLFQSGNNLSTTLGQLSAAHRQKLSDVIDEMGMDRSSFTTNTTLRTFLLTLAGQFQEVDIWPDVVM